MNCGYSLLELLIAIFISALLATQLLEIYLSLKKNYRAYHEQLQSDQEIRLSMMRINPQIRKAGYQGCINKEEPVNSLDAIRGYSANTVPRNYGITAKPETDVLLIRACEYYQNHWQFLRKAIYIGKTKRKEKNGKVIYALYEKKIPGKSEELSELIHSLKIKYGEKCKDRSEVCSYKNSNEVKDWSIIISLEYQLNQWVNGYVSLRERT